jgi:hypothetical protein
MDLDILQEDERGCQTHFLVRHDQADLAVGWNNSGMAHW